MQQLTTDTSKCPSFQITIHLFSNLRKTIPTCVWGQCRIVRSNRHRRCNATCWRRHRRMRGLTELYCYTRPTHTSSPCQPAGLSASWAATMPSCWYFNVRTYSILYFNVALGTAPFFFGENVELKPLESVSAYFLTTDKAIFRKRHQTIKQIELYTKCKIWVQKCRGLGHVTYF